jgi:hypothetical protein
MPLTLFQSAPLPLPVEDGPTATQGTAANAVEATAKRRKSEIDTAVNCDGIRDEIARQTFFVCT